MARFERFGKLGRRDVGGGAGENRGERSQCIQLSENLHLKFNLLRYTFLRYIINQSDHHMKRKLETKIFGFKKIAYLNVNDIAR
jgi:hypothetical protein